MKSKQKKFGAGYAGDSAELTREEIGVFLHNAQIALVNSLKDDRVPAVFYLKEHIKGLIEPGNKFTADEWATVMASIAWDLFFSNTLRLQEKGLK